MPSAGSDRDRPFFDLAAPLVLAESADREIVIGCIGRLHNLIDQQFVPLADADDFRRFHHPDFEKHAENFRISGSDEASCILVAEHRTQALGPSARWKFRLYWYGMVGWASNLLLKLLLQAVKRRAERSVGLSLENDSGAAERSTNAFPATRK
jgi:hypothetical protein